MRAELKKDQFPKGYTLDRIVCRIFLEGEGYKRIFWEEEGVTKT